ncbi:hypothetical protein HNR06_002892 [Nocardiopsis arvandica]|uniref:Uncharacterized protein n=1 Tax=Nocardiopsis sinuspersici TaxID=501010 RepID=A0A7Y9XCQ2_9ACTN|nr:hypothetical protein [Nocardiopsis sinuspersici]NYH53303.1 hypothetical protein [Nocardiopsis sinuspersici]
MYDSENDSWGWSGWDNVGNAWKDAAHAVVPWEEWGDRPGYVIGTALLNIGATVGGAVIPDWLREKLQEEAEGRAME